MSDSFKMESMDKELKNKFFAKFEENLRGVAESQSQGKDAASGLSIGQWLFTYVPNFIEEVYQVGKEVGDLEGRLKGYEKGVEEEIERQKKALDELSKLN